MITMPGKAPSPDNEPEPLPTVDREQQRVVEWRMRALVRAGYDDVAAELIATDTTIDLHVAVDLVTVRGCEPSVATGILI